MGLYASALMVSYRDIQYVLPVVTQFLLYASPVAYAFSAVPARWHFVFALNPLTGLLEAFRWSLLGVGTLDFGLVGYSTLVTMIVFLFGALAFKSMERKFADVI